MAQTPQVARFSYGSAGAYQLPLSNGALDGFGVRNLGVLNVQGGSNPTMPVWSQPQPRDCDDGLVGPGGWNGHMGRYYGSDAVATDSSRFWGTNQEDDGARLHPGNMIDEIVLPPDIVTQTPGMMTNERVHYQWPLNKDCLYYSRILNPQMPVFVRTVTSNPVVMRQGMPFKSGAWEGFYSVFNVPTLNYNLACSNFEGEVDKTPAELLSEYAFGGVLVTTRGCEFSEQPQTASVVVGIKGPERVFNIWGAQLEANTPLYFIIKMVDELPPYYFLDPEGQRADAPTGAGRALKRKCLQIIPYANHLHQVPPPHLLRYTDNDNQVRYGSWVRIGRVEHRTVNGDPDAVVTAFMSTKSMIRLPNFAVLLDQPIVQHYN